MVLTWTRTVSHRSFTAIIVVSTLAISLRVLFSPFLSQRTYSAELERVVFVPHIEVDLPIGPVVPGDIVDVTVGPQPEPDREPEPWNSGDSGGVSSLGEHRITPDGLLVVNPDGPHPIFQLISEAEANWESKLARASKTLEEAVKEYKRRYRRAPPRGFDKWWEYVVKHDVQLPDEYDEIYEDLEPFWGIDPYDLALTQEELEARDGVITVEKIEGASKFEVVGSTVPKERLPQLRGTIERILDLVKEVEGDLPELRISFSPFDNPSMLSDWRIKNMALEAAGNGTTIKRADMPSTREAGWIQACPPDSPARLNPPDLPQLTTTPPIQNISSPKTFIASHRATMNPCNHPSLLTSHGQFLSHKSGPFPQRTLVPRFSLCSTLLHHDIRPPVPYGWTSGENVESEGDSPWELKFDERLNWRGSTTGIYASPTSLWKHAHRSRLVTLTNAFEDPIRVLPVPKDDTSAVGEGEMVRLARMNPAWMDVAFTEGPLACDESGGTCEEMEGLWEFRRRQGRKEEGRYKFILDVDGNGWSGRFKRLITGNALIFKATIYPEWYTSRIAPWVHYIPIQVSYTDLYDSVAFFRVHDELANRIAKAGRDWSRRFWRKEDMTAYLYRLLLEYARVSSLDRSSMDYS